MNLLQPSRYIEITTPLFSTSTTAKYFAECLIDTPFLVNRKTSCPAAFIKSIVIQPNIFICEINITEDNLEENYDDIYFVCNNYTEVDFSKIFKLH